MKRSQCRRGLTLIETLVVVAILGVLLAIVFVATGPVREKGRQAVCIANLRQIGKAIALYRQDYGGGAEEGRYFEMALPPNVVILLRSGHLGNWKPSPQPPAVWICPDAPRRPVGFTSYIYTVCDNKYGGIGTPVPPCGDPQHQPDFPDKVRRRGSEYPLVIDDNHNFGRNPSDPLFVIALRLGGHVNSRYVADPFSPGWQW